MAVMVVAMGFFASAVRVGVVICGAWEIAMRYSAVNLNDGLVLGGKQSNVTIPRTKARSTFFRRPANYRRRVAARKAGRLVGATHA